MQRVVVREGPAVAGENPVPIAMAMIDLVGADELPQFYKCFEVVVCLLTEPFVHQQKGIETLGLNPPEFTHVVGPPENLALVVKPSVPFVPSPN